MDFSTDETGASDASQIVIHKEPQPVEADVLCRELREEKTFDALMDRVAEDEPKDEEEPNVMENIIPIKNILHGWSMMAGWAADTVSQVCHNPTVELAWQATVETTSAAAGRTYELSSHLAEELSPAVESLASATSAGWDALSSAVYSGANVLAETSSATISEISANLSDDALPAAGPVTTV